MQPIMAESTIPSMLLAGQGSGSGIAQVTNMPLEQESHDKEFGHASADPGIASARALSAFGPSVDSATFQDFEQSVPRLASLENAAHLAVLYAPQMNVVGCERGPQTRQIEFLQPAYLPQVFPTKPWPLVHSTAVQIFAGRSSDLTFVGEPAAAPSSQLEPFPSHLSWQTQCCQSYAIIAEQPSPSYVSGAAITPPSLSSAASWQHASSSQQSLAEPSTAPADNSLPPISAGYNVDSLHEKSSSPMMRIG